MAYKLRYSDYPGTDTGPPDPERWVGPTGPPGATGATGPTGPQGTPGSLGYVLATGSTTPRLVQDRFAEVANVMDFGAVGDWNWTTMTGTNDRAVIQALLNSPPAGRRIVFPAGRQFYVGTGLVVPPNAALYLCGTDFSGYPYPPTTSGLVADPNCDVLTITGAGSCVVECMTFSTRATVQPTAGAGIHVLGGRRITLRQTVSYNNYESYKFEGNDTNGGLGAYLIEPYAAKCVRAFIVQKTWAELYISGGGRIGNGPDWTTPQAHISIEGGSTTNGASGPNSLSLVGVQCQAAAGPVNFIQFVNRTPGAIQTGIDAISIDDAVMEAGSPGMTNIFFADSSWSFIERFSMSGMYINAGTAEFWGFPSTMTVISGSICGNQFLNTATFTLAPTAGMSLQMAGQQLDSNVALTSNASSSTVSMIGMEIIGNVTIAGVWRGLTIEGGTITGTLTNTATGNVNILVPNQTNIMTGDLNIGSNTAASQVDLRLNAAAGQVRALHFQSAGVERMSLGLTAGNNVAMTIYDPAGALIGSAMAVSTATGLPTFALGAAVTRAAPASATAAGVTGELATDTGFVYVCTANNTWKRVAVTAW